MKQTFAVLVWAGVIISTTAAEFMNLDFEQAKTTPAGLTSDLLPGWSLSYNDAAVVGMNFNRVAIGSGPEFAIFSREAFAPPSFLTNVANIMTGRFVFLAQDLQPISAFLSQVGDIPPGATELRLAAFKDNSTFLRTFLNGTEIINGDISAFAGQQNVRLDVEMGLVRNGTVVDLVGPNIWLDRIEFVPVPEPSSGALVILGVWVLLGRPVARRRVIRRAKIG